jgi:hypothetical protein
MPARRRRAKKSVCEEEGDFNVTESAASAPMGECLLITLPQELLEMACSYLHVRDFLALRSVCASRYHLFLISWRHASSFSSS